MKHTKEQLYEINIHVLRSIAREVGVKAPTTLTKQALMNEIIQIEQGEKQPCTPTKKGRPLKDGGEGITVKNEKPTASPHSTNAKKKIKKEFIDSILKEIERKLNELL